MDMNSKPEVFIILLGVVASLILPINLYGEDRVHIVQRGETFFSIARAQGLSAEALMRHNGITDPNRLLVGQRLRIPGTGGEPRISNAAPSASASSSVTATNGLVEYRVARGDTLFGIARKFSLTVVQIREINNLSENHVLREGAALRLPAGPGTAGLPAIASQSSNGLAGSSGTAVQNVPLRWPVNAREINTMTGKLDGVVITGTRGEPVISLTRGTVLSAGPYRGFGRVVIIQVDGGYIYVYGGCESLYVKEGDRVGPGSELGRLGIDPVSNRPQLFFMVYRANNPIDPALAPRA